MAPQLRLTLDQVETVISGALAIEAAEAEGVTVDELLQLADELGVSRDAVRRSLDRLVTSRPEEPATVVDRIIGPSGVTVERWTSRDRGRATTDLVRRLDRYQLTRIDGTRWVQELDWWPDPQRGSARVLLDVGAADEASSSSTVLRIRARLGGARRGHVLTALLGAAAIPLWVVGVLPALLAATGTGAVLGAIGAYRLRLRDVEHCLVELLDRVAAEG